MIAVDRKSEPRKCPLCQSDYNEKDYRPESLIPCGHTFCSKCIVNFERACKMCASSYNQIITDYEMLDMLKQKISKISINEKDQQLNLSIKDNKLKPEIYHLIMSGTKSQQLMGTEMVRKLLSVERNPPIQEVIDAPGLLNKMIEFLEDKQHPKLQFEAAWVIINVASGTTEQTRAVIKAGAIPSLVKLTQDANEDLQEQAVWALGNIAGDNVETRNLVVEAGLVEPLLKILKEKKKKLSVLSNSVWCFLNICRGKPHVPFYIIKPGIPILNEIIETQTDEGILSDACWALSYISDGNGEEIQAVLNSVNLKKLLGFLDRSNPVLITPTLRVFGNIVTGDDKQTQTIVDLGILRYLKEYLKHNKMSIKVETCWFISNITAGTQEQIQAVIDADIIPDAILNYENGSFKLKNEIAWIVANLTSGGTREQIEYMVEKNGIELLLAHLKIDDKTKAKVALEGLDNILKFYRNDAGGYDSGGGIIAQKIEELDVENQVEEAREIIDY